MKILLGFFIGMTVALLLVLTMNHSAPSVSADAAPAPVAVTTDTPSATLPDGMDVAGLMPDVKKIYNNALGGPYRQVETEITDPDIARYFRSYMDATGLDKVGLENK
jgi:hypothetical protein